MNWMGKKMPLPPALSSQTVLVVMAEHRSRDRIIASSLIHSDTEELPPWTSSFRLDKHFILDCRLPRMISSSSIRQRLRGVQFFFWSDCMRYKKRCERKFCTRFIFGRRSILNVFITMKTIISRLLDLGAFRDGLERNDPSFRVTEGLRGRMKFQF